MIRIEQAGLCIGGRALLRDVDLDVRAGECTVLIGPNGAGKSTLLRIISGTMKPTSGRVLIDDRPVGSYGPQDLAHRRAMLSQSHDGGEGFTVEELVRLALRRTSRRMTIAEQRGLIDGALSDVGLAGWNDRIVGTLSGGERQRAHFARVLVQLRVGAGDGPPGALLLDEPIAAQDPAQQLRVIDVARAHADAGGAVLLVLHDLNWAARVADRIIAMKQGKVVADDVPDRVLTGAVLSRLFDVDLSPNVAPQDMPFVLPQMTRMLATP